MGTILIIVLILLLIGVIPNWHGGGYGPPGLIGIVLVIIVILVLTGRL